MASVAWSSRVVRTGGASGPLHEEWAISVGVECDVPVRGVAFADIEGVRWHARDWARRAELVAQLDVSFAPYDSAHSDVVQVSAAAGGVRLSASSAALKSDPVATAMVDVEPGTPGWTGVPVGVLKVPAPGLSLGVLLVRSTDTRANLTRWRVRDEHTSGLGGFAFFATGQRSGRVQTEPLMQ